MVVTDAPAFEEEEDVTGSPFLAHIPVVRAGSAQFAALTAATQGLR